MHLMEYARRPRRRRWSGGLIAATIAFLWPSPPAGASEPRFTRGDTDGNGKLELTDGIRVLLFLFLFQGEATPGCLDAADVDDSGQIQLTDGVRVFLFLFAGGAAPAAPFPECGIDPTPVPGLSCIEEPEACAPDEFAALAASFGILDTLAGKGATDGDNGWRSSFEGGPARDAELSAPHNALGDDAGNVYIADKEGHGIRKVTPDGEIFTVAGTSGAGNGSDEPGPGTERALRNPNGIWVRGDGTVYILDLDNEKVRRLAPDGQLTTLFTVPGLTLGRGLWVADDESLAYVSSGDELKRWTPGSGPGDGVTTHASGFSRLANISVDREGNVIATDQGRHTVFKVALDGTYEPIAGNGTTTGGGDGEPALETGLNEVRGVWLIENGGYFLATHEGSQVWYVDSRGTIHLFLDGSRGAHAGDGEPFDTAGEKVSEVRNVTMDRQGNLLVTENDNGFVRIVRRR